MSLNYTHKPNYFLFAQLLVRHIEDYAKKQPDAAQFTFELADIYDLFRHDLASTTVNLEGILNIADDYRVTTANGDEKLIESYDIDGEANTLSLIFNPEALAALREGQPLVAPDASLQ